MRRRAPVPQWLVPYLTPERLVSELVSFAFGIVFSTGLGVVTGLPTVILIPIGLAVACLAAAGLIARQERHKDTAAPEVASSIRTPMVIGPPEATVTILDARDPLAPGWATHRPRLKYPPKSMAAVDAMRLLRRQTTDIQNALLARGGGYATTPIHQAITELHGNVRTIVLRYVPDRWDDACAATDLLPEFWGQDQRRYRATEFLPMTDAVGTLLTEVIGDLE